MLLYIYVCVCVCVCMCNIKHKAVCFVIFQILDQCVHRLGLNQAARRLYTADGTLVLDTDDLIEWVQQEYVRQAKRQLRAEAKARRQNQQGDSNDKGLFFLWFKNQ